MVPKETCFGDFLGQLVPHRSDIPPQSAPDCFGCWGGIFWPTVLRRAENWSFWPCHGLSMWDIVRPLRCSYQQQHARFITISQNVQRSDQTFWGGATVPFHTFERFCHWWRSWKLRCADPRWCWAMQPGFIPEWWIGNPRWSSERFLFSPICSLCIFFPADLYYFMSELLLFGDIELTPYSFLALGVFVSSLLDFSAIYFLGEKLIFFEINGKNTFFWTKITKFSFRFIFFCIGRKINSASHRKIFGWGWAE